MNIQFEEQPKKYPYLGKYKSIVDPHEKIVLFLKPKYGMVVYNSDPHIDGDPAGMINDLWIEEYFEVIHGKVTIEL